MSDSTETESNRSATFSLADMESCPWHEALVKKRVKTFTTPVSIHVHSKRARLTDADSVSAKAAIDGLVHAGLLQDDSPEFVKSVSYSQEKTEKGDPEETIITIQEI
jgi:hypothetical protein